MATRARQLAKQPPTTVKDENNDEQQSSPENTTYTRANIIRGMNGYVPSSRNLSTRQCDNLLANSRILVACRAYTGPAYGSLRLDIYIYIYIYIIFIGAYTQPGNLSTTNNNNTHKQRQPT